MAHPSADWSNPMPHSTNTCKGITIICHRLHTIYNSIPCKVPTHTCHYLIQLSCRLRMCFLHMRDMHLRFLRHMQLRLYNEQHFWLLWHMNNPKLLSPHKPKQNSAQMKNPGLEIRAWPTILHFANAPAVFKFQIDVVSGHAKHEFSAITDMSWMEFHHQVVSHLDSNGDPAYNVSGNTGKASHPKNEADFEMAIGRVYQWASAACTRDVSMEVKNIVREW